MANPDHVERITQALKSGNAAPWNQWRRSKYRIDDVHGYVSEVEVDLSGADLQGRWSFSQLDLADANLRDAQLDGTYFHSANLRRVDLRGASLVGTDLRRAVLDGADLSAAALNRCDLGAASLIDTNASKTDLRDASLFGTRLQRTNLQGADLSGASIYGISAWDLNLKDATQSDLVITPPEDSEITVDNLEVAQFVYLLVNNASIRGVIDTITSKAVLILGRFTKERKAILDAIRQELRRRDYLPIVFDFEKPKVKTLTETVQTLAHMSRFIIADITDAKSIPQELAVVVPHLPTVPVQPILAAGHAEYGMFEHFKHYPWVLQLYPYKNQAALLAALSDHVIGPVETKVAELAGG